MTRRRGTSPLPCSAAVPTAVLAALMMMMLGNCGTSGTDAFVLPTTTRRTNVATSRGGGGVVALRQVSKVGQADSTVNLETIPLDFANADAPMYNENGGKIQLSSDQARSQLFDAFTALSVPDQYDAVLTGLCAKILDRPEERQQEEEEAAAAGVVALQDPMQLMQEMNQRKIRASPRSVMALIDSTVKTQDPKCMARTLRLCARNGGIARYGSLQASVIPLPTSPASTVQCPDGVVRTRQQRLTECLGKLPEDERQKEVAGAVASGAVVAAAMLSHVAGADDISPYADTLVTAMVAAGIVDNFYDVLRVASSVAIDQLAGEDDGDEVDDSADVGETAVNGRRKQQKQEEDINILPEKESLPLGLGTGQLTGSVVRGWTRLLTADAERESQCEAAALFAAYALGLPTFAFRPNAYEAAVLVAESMGEDNSNTGPNNEDKAVLDPLLSGQGVLRVLIWLLAPVAMENMKHSQLIMSDPREAAGLLDRLEDFAREKGEDLQVLLWWTESEQERADLLQWAFGEAELLLRDNMDAVSAISKRLIGGAATIGDCIAAVEEW